MMHDDGDVHVIKKISCGWNQYVHGMFGIKTYMKVM